MRREKKRLSFDWFWICISLLSLLVLVLQNKENRSTRSIFPKPARVSHTFNVFQKKLCYCFIQCQQYHGTSNSFLKCSSFCSRCYHFLGHWERPRALNVGLRSSLQQLRSVAPVIQSALLLAHRLVSNRGPQPKKQVGLPSSCSAVVIFMSNFFSLNPLCSIKTWIQNFLWFKGIFPIASFGGFFEKKTMHLIWLRP